MSHEETGSAFWSGILWYRVPILFGAFSILFVILSITIFIKSYQSSEPIRFSSEVMPSNMASNAGMLVIDIEGGVNNPGVYALPAGSRVEEGLMKAGGLSPDADMARISQSMNRAAKITDGAKLYVPRISDQSGPESDTAVLGSETATTININTASSSELESLSGIGPVLAGKIIAGRPYQRVEELVERQVIGQALFAKIRDTLTL